MAIKRGKKYNTYDVSVSFQIKSRGKTAKEAERNAVNNWRRTRELKNFKVIVDWPFGDSIAETKEEKEWEDHMNYQDLCEEETNIALSDLSFEEYPYERLPIEECEEGENGSL